MARRRTWSCGASEPYQRGMLVDTSTVLLERGQDISRVPIPWTAEQDSAGLLQKLHKVRVIVGAKKNEVDPGRLGVCRSERESVGLKGSLSVSRPQRSQHRSLARFASPQHHTHRVWMSHKVLVSTPISSCYKILGPRIWYRPRTGILNEI